MYCKYLLISVHCNRVCVNLKHFLKVICNDNLAAVDDFINARLQKILHCIFKKHSDFWLEKAEQVYYTLY